MRDDILRQRLDVDVPARSSLQRNTWIILPSMI